jgi:electron-transferring-flavoprotein dehydrogenase
MAPGAANGRVVPAAYRPPVDSRREFIKRELDDEDERIEVGVAIVGGGPAGLACANRLLQRLADEPELMERLGEVPVAVIEKGKACGAHNLSGAMMRPSGLQELFPDLSPSDWPTYGQVDRDAVYWMLSPSRALPLRPTPPPFRNHGNYVVSVAELSRWMAERAEEAGAYILTETSAHQLLVEDGVVRGIRSGDKGRGREGEELGNFEPGSDLIAQATVLAEGTQGHLAGAAINHFNLASDDPPQWELGVKEVWEVKQPLDRVVHSMGWPLRFRAKYREFGGCFLYPMGEDKVSIGFVAGLDYRDATFSVHDTLQLFKTHPKVKKILEGGKRVAWGAKTIPSGGYWAMPKQLWAPGMVLAGDSASMVNIPKLKGIHLAMHAGMFAAESIYEKLSAGADCTDLSNYQEKVEDSVIEKDLHRSRNMRQPFGKGFFAGAAIVQPMELSGGRFPGGHFATHDDANQPVFIGKRWKKYPKPDGKYTFDKLSSVFATGNQSRDDAPSHIRIKKKVPLELGLMWQQMCPAQVYEVPEEILEQLKNGENGAIDPKQEIEIDVAPSNCVQCGAITAKGGRLTPPEGGEGPNYQQT